MPLGTYLHGSAVATGHIRGALLLALSEAGTIWGAASITDAGGGATQSWTAGAAVVCRIDPLGASAGQLVGERMDERSTHVVTVPPRTAISTSSRFAIGGRGSFEVTALRQETDELATMFEVVQI